MSEGPKFHEGLVRGNSVDLWVERAGTGPSLVLLHGLAGDHRLWERVAPTFRMTFDTVSVDLPGHGRSGPVPAGAPIGWFADEIAGLLDELAVSDPIVVGLSMGGGVAQYLAINHGHHLRGLILVSTSPVFDQATKERLLARAQVAERQGMSELVGQAVARWFTPAFVTKSEDLLFATRDAVQLVDPTNFARASAANANRDCSSQLHSISCPTLFVYGLEDPAATSRTLDLYQSHLRSLQVEAVANASHLLPLEAPDTFIAVVKAFAGSLP